VALLVIRYLELRMNQTKLPAVIGHAQKDASRLFSAFELIDSLRKYTCSHAGEHIYNFHYTDDIIRSMEKVFGLDLNKRFRKRSDIRNFFAAMKK
jgi:hypothetical protein